MNSQDASRSREAWTPLDLISYMWKRRRLIASATLVCIVAAALVSLLLPKKYEATAVLALMPTPVKEAKNKDAQQVGLFSKALGVKDYVVILKSDSILAKIADQVRKSAKLPADDIDRLCALHRLRDITTVTSTVVDKTAYNSSYSPVITLTATAGTPEAAFEIAQAWAEVAVEESDNLYLKGEGSQAKFLAHEMKLTEEEMNKVLDDQQANEALYDPDAAKEWLTDMTVLLTTLEEQHYAAQTDLETSRKEAESLRAQLAQQPPKLVLLQAPPDTALYLEKTLGNKPPDPPSAEPRGYQREEVNPTYVETSNLLTTAEKTMKGLEEKEKTLAANIEALQKKIDQTRQDFAVQNKQRKLLDKKFAVVGANYQDMADRLDQANVAEAKEASLGDLKLAADAVIPDKPTGPNKSYIVATAAVLGFVAACLAAAFGFILKNSQPPSAAAKAD